MILTQIYTFKNIKSLYMIMFYKFINYISIKIYKHKLMYIE
jgi:hypothetical protein